MRNTIAFSALILAVAACESNTQDVRPAPRVSIYRIDAASSLLSSTYSGFRDAQRSVVRDADTWRQIWTAANAIQPAPSAPQVDFGAESVLLVATGWKPSGGHAVSVDSVDTGAAELVVYYTSIAPGPNCVSTSVITNPVHIVKVPGRVGTAAWRETAKTLAC